MSHEGREKQDQFLLQLFERGIVALEKIATSIDALNKNYADLAKKYNEHMKRHA